MVNTLMNDFLVTYLEHGIAVPILMIQYMV
jgi:hypothetical protein